MISCIVACDDSWGIAAQGEIPWLLRKDLRFFQQVTTATAVGSKLKNACIMGRKTWESIPSTKRPLKGRHNIVLSRRETLDLPSGVLHARSLLEAFELAQALPVETSFVIGGESLYKEALSYCDVLYITHVRGHYLCDTFFPEPEGFEEIYSSSLNQEGKHTYCFKTYQRKDRNELFRNEI